MKKSRYSEEQIAFALRQAETGTPVAEVVRKMGVREQTFHRRMKLEEENRKLKKFVADLSLDKLMLQDVLSRELEGLAGGASAVNSDTTISEQPGK